MTSEEFLRHAESSVLDVQHKTLPLWKHNRLEATFASLVQYDSFAIIAIMGPPQLGGVGHVQLLKGLDEGLAQALLWLHDGKTRVDLTPSNDFELIKHAGNFCKFATTYVDLADFHKMYGRKQASIEVDETARTIRFVTLRDKSPTAGVLGMVEQTNRLQKLMTPPRTPEVKTLVEVAHGKLRSAPIRYEMGRIVLDDVKIVNDEDLRKLFSLLMPVEPILLDDTDDLSGFTVAELRDFFDALKRWSFCCVHLFLESLMNRGKQQWECIPTQHVPRVEFVEKMVQLSGLSRDKVEGITERLTYDDRTRVPNVFQQPLFCGPTHVSWSVLVVQNSKYMRNMLKLMSRTKSLQKHAANLIGCRERAMLRELGDLFSRRGKCSYKLTTALSHGGEVAEVDLLAFNEKFRDEVLIVEGKAVLGVDEINEVDAATDEMIAGQDQLAKRINLLESMPLDQKQALFKFVKWSPMPKCYGVVVTADAEPNNRYDHTTFPGISLQTIKDRLRDNHLGSPLKFWRACHDRNWLKDFAECQEIYRPIKIGDVTYELPALKRKKHFEDESEL